MLLEKMGCRNCDCTYLVERKNGEPELIMTLENDHNPVALFDAERLEIIRRLS